MPEERDKIYSIWTSMKARCSNSNDKDYSRYGGRGIKVCKSWQDSFDAFMKDMGARKPGQTLERKNNDGNYEPGNVVWSDRATQAKNRNHAESETHSFDAEIFSVGTWNGDKYEHADLQDMVDNFSKLIEAIKPPLKLGHDNKRLGDGAPALGWVTALKKNGDKLIATLSEVPDIVFKAIQKRLYKRVSSEIMWNFKHAGNVFKRVLAGVALLGADVPAVKNLEDLEAFLSQTVIDENSFEALKAYSFDTDSRGAIKQEPKNERVKDMSEDRIKELETRIDTLKKEYTDKEKEAEATAKENAELKQKQLEAAKTQQIESLKTFCEDQVKAGKITPAQRDAIFDEKAVHVYSEADGVSISADRFKKFIELSDKKLDTDEKGKHKKGEETASAHDQIVDKINKYIDENKVEYDVAYTEVLKRNPELAEAYTKGGD